MGLTATAVHPVERLPPLATVYRDTAHRAVSLTSNAGDLHDRHQACQPTRRTFENVDLPDARKAIGSKLVLKVKT